MASKSENTLSLTPYIIVKGADAAIAFYSRVFGAKEDYEACR